VTRIVRDPSDGSVRAIPGRQRHQSREGVFTDARQLMEATVESNERWYLRYAEATGIRSL
jgi:hypothetical protein